MNYYTTIDDMPIWNWRRISETGDLKYLFIKCKGLVTSKLEVIWHQLQDEYIAKFGLEPNFIKQLNLKKEISELRYDFVVTGDRFNNTLISIAEGELRALESQNGITFHELKDHMEKYKGYRIDPKTTSVTEWHTTIKNMQSGEND